LETARGDVIFAEIYFMKKNINPSYEEGSVKITHDSTEPDSNINFTSGPMIFSNVKYVGYYSIGDKALCIHFKNKPHFIHRLFTKVLLSWKWYDTN
jgi:hypothetical protein